MSCLLIEIGCEEIPAKLLAKLERAFADEMTEAFEQAELTFREIKTFATPRRLAVMLDAVQTQQVDKTMVRKGPPVAAAYGKDGQLTPAGAGFLKSCGVDEKDLQRQTFGKAEYLVAEVKVVGKPLTQLLPDFLRQVVGRLPLPKTMRWGDNDYGFIRPVHWLVVMLDESVVDCELFGCQSANETYGHRFHYPGVLVLKRAQDYLDVLDKTGFVMACQETRCESIVQQIKDISAELDGQVEIDEDLLAEVNGLVEWPVPLLVDFDEDFLAVPKEALIAAMHGHQKCFPVSDRHGKLLPHFVTVSNIVSRHPESVIEGNARVMRARLSDAAFFYQTDLKTSLQARFESLKSVVFQEKLGSLFEKSERMMVLSAYLAETLDASCTAEEAEKCAQLAKCDLVSEMVYEFPELQGIMGMYYARSDGLSDEISLGIRQHYLPRFSGDDLPTGSLGIIVALADRVDTLVGIFGVGLKPTGEKDPFALRRAALGVLRIVLTHQLPVDVKALVEEAFKAYPKRLLTEKDVVGEVVGFIFERLKSWYQEQGVDTKVILSVLACKPTRLVDFDLRVQAVKLFLRDEDTESLIELNKRLANILRKAEVEKLPQVKENLFMDDAEKVLFKKIGELQERVEVLCGQGDYYPLLQALITLKVPVGQFFDDVMVMVDDKAVRLNRLALLQQLRQIFLMVADLSELG